MALFVLAVAIPTGGAYTDGYYWTGNNLQDFCQKHDRAGLGYAAAIADEIGINAMSINEQGAAGQTLKSSSAFLTVLC